MHKAQYYAALREKWTLLIQACQVSPLTIAAFARDNKMSEASLYHWSKRLGLPLKHKPEPDISFIELPLGAANAVLSACNTLSDTPALSLSSPKRSSVSTERLLRDAPSVSYADQKVERQVIARNLKPIPEASHQAGENHPDPISAEAPYCVQMSTPRLNITLHLPWPQVMAMIKTLA